MFKRRKIYLVVLYLMLSADLLKHVIRHAKIPLQTTRKNIKKKRKDERLKKIARRIFLFFDRFISTHVYGEMKNF